MNDAGVARFKLPERLVVIDTGTSFTELHVPRDDLHHCDDLSPLRRWELR
jgi:hypothetical protein